MPAMTEVAFHFNAPDKLAYTCRVARKVIRSGARLWVVAPPDLVQKLDALMWEMGPRDFVAHCTADAAPQLLAHSPIVLASKALEPTHQSVLLNLHTHVPQGFDQFARLIEVVSTHDDADRLAARQRWREYTALGYPLIRHDLALKAD